MNKFVAIGIAVLLFFVSAYGSFSFFSQPDGEEIAYEPPVDPEAGLVDDGGPKTEECPLNGKLHSEERRQLWESRRPMGVMVENSLDSRPQSGLNSADVSYEVVAEAGITRFLNIFYCQDAEYVGPVRSARIYFIKLLQGYGNYPLYAHVGGATTPGRADALGEIRELGWHLYNDLDQFGVGYPNYWRDAERLPGVSTEHTMYTNTIKMFEYAKENRGLTDVDEEGTAWDEGFEPWIFKDSAEASARGDVSEIAYGFWDGPSYSSDYSVSWDYDSEENVYLRNNGGVPHMDKNTDEQLQASSVVVMQADESPVDDGYEGATHLYYDIVGTGEALIFQDGDVIETTWEKDDEESMIRFYDDSSNEVEFVRGKIWVSVLPTGNEVEYGSFDADTAASDEEDAETEEE
jgi:hypothetical protein